jgi:hypothetical protein
VRLSWTRRLQFFVEERPNIFLTLLAKQLMTKLASKVDGGEAENIFSGSDQSLDALISAMEEAQVGEVFLRRELSHIMDRSLLRIFRIGIRS